MCSLLLLVVPSFLFWLAGGGQDLSLSPSGSGVLRPLGCRIQKWFGAEHL